MSLLSSHISDANISTPDHSPMLEFKDNTPSNIPGISGTPRNSKIEEAASAQSRPLESYTFGAASIVTDAEPITISAVKVSLVPSTIEEVSESALKELTKITTILSTLEAIYNLMKGEGSINSASILAQSIDQFITEAKETTEAIKGLQEKIKSGDTAGAVDQYITLLKEIQETKTAGGALIESLKKAGQDTKQAIQETVGFFKSLFSCCLESSSK